MFGIAAEPLGGLTAAFLAKGKWKETLAVYGIMLAAYFVHRYRRMLPLWTVLDLLLAFVLIYPVSRIRKNIWRSSTRLFPVALLLTAFVSTVADSLTRVFLLVPAGLYLSFGLSYEALAYGLFIPCAMASYVEDLMVMVATLVAGVPLVVGLNKVLQLKESLA
jgi:hypothetical protein